MTCTELAVLLLEAEEQCAAAWHYYTLPPAVPYRGYQLEELTLVPQPVHRPVECWQPIVSATPRAMDFMIKYGIKIGRAHV